MSYPWEEECIKKYGHKQTMEFIQFQMEYERINASNDCKYCGHNNKGTVVHLENGSSFIIHYGLWSIEGKCLYCKKIRKDN